jgi:cell cycle checkpoint protein
MVDSFSEVTPQPQSRNRLFRPPLRLNWPSLLPQRRTERRQSDTSKHILPMKRSRPLPVVSSTLDSISKNDEYSNFNDLWPVRHTPQSSTELVVAPKKVQEMRQWMKGHTNAIRQALSKDSTPFTSTQAPPMLVLVGSPGIGKSTAIRCLAVELEFEISEWTESFITNYEHGDRTSGYGKNMNIHFSNPLDAFEQFLQQCGSDILPLSTQVPLVAQTAAGVPSSRDSHHTNKVVVVDELPYTHSIDAKERLQNILTTHIRRPNAVPTIFICSDTAEGKIRYDELERYIHPQTLYEKSLCQILAINTPTKPKFRKVIHDIMASECAVGMKHRSSFPSSNTYVDELYDRCNGDLRFAINTLQFEMIGDGWMNRNSHRNHGATGRRTSSKLLTSCATEQRDSKLSPFHALGKLLYAKRQAHPAHAAVPHIAEGTQLPLEFDPDNVIQQTDMELGDILYFLSYHSVDFFTDIDDLSTAMTYFSDASTLCDHPCTSGLSLSSLSSIATSMAGRVVAHANKHPAPLAFRSLGAPKVYDMIRKRRSNQDRIEEYSQRIWLQEHLRNAKIGGRVNTRTFGMDLLPYVRTILPCHHISTSHLDSMFGSKITNATALSNSTHPIAVVDQDDEALELWREQEEILKADDIVEDIGDEEGW